MHETIQLNGKGNERGTNTFALSFMFGVLVLRPYSSAEACDLGRFVTSGWSSGFRGSYIDFDSFEEFVDEGNISARVAFISIGRRRRLCKDGCLGLCFAKVNKSILNKIVRDPTNDLHGFLTHHWVTVVHFLGT